MAKRSRKFVAILSAVVIALALVSSSVYANCADELLEKARSIYHKPEQKDIANISYEEVCQTDNTNNEFGGTYKNIGLVDRYGHIATACAQKDRDFFKKHAAELLKSILPPETIPSCFLDSLALTVVQSDNESVTIRAAFQPPRRNLVPRVNRLVIYPPASLKCEDSFIKDSPIKAGGEEMHCIRKDNVVTSISLDTTLGTRTVFLDRIPEVIKKTISWQHYVGDPDTLYKCKDASDPANPIPRGDFVDCNIDKVCGKNESDSGWCASRFGNYYFLIDGERVDILK